MIGVVKVNMTRLSFLISIHADPSNSRKDSSLNDLKMRMGITTSQVHRSPGYVCGILHTANGGIRFIAPFPRRDDEWDTRDVPRLFQFGNKLIV